MHNKHFSRIKDINKGRTAILIAPGPSLKNFEDNFPNDFIRVAVNGVIIHKDIAKTLDYYIWAGDLDIPRHPTPSEKPIRENIKYLKDTCKSYTCCWTDNQIIHPNKCWKIQTQIHPDDAKKLKGNWELFNQSENTKVMTKNPENEGLNASTVVLQALNIILYSGVSKIILVGVDAGGKGHSYRDLIENDICDWSEENKPNNQLVKIWEEAKTWVSENYPDVQIYNYNPVFLKEIFPEWKN